ncbi:MULTISPECIES: hypothetical protein [Streptomyces]|uniref:hypothetical protein n=1 Tax=Streptomyces TaxID=1883 RepID=UPI0004D61153|nr:MULTISPECIES: hypothetical protein [Streptomyces]OFA52353.1 hypothetical protein BEN35_11850 [Streptomyces fradiae]
MEIYREHGAGWSLWTYKDIGLQGIVHAAPDSPYLRRIRPALEQKERLGTDSWGGSDAGVRDILDPIDALFEREFPGYEPYPWGRRQHIAGLVRHGGSAGVQVSGDRDRGHRVRRTGRLAHVPLRIRAAFEHSRAPPRTGGTAPCRACHDA